MVTETKAAMVAAVGSAGAVESFQKTVSGRILGASWRKRSAAERAFEVLTFAFDLEPRDLAIKLRQLFDDRNKAIHSAETDDPVEPHPLGTNTGAGNAHFTVERAAEASALATGLLLDCVSHVRTGAPFAGLKVRLGPHQEGLRERARQVAALKARLKA